MKVSVYIEDNKKQIDFMPENEFEEDVIKSILKEEVEIECLAGTFSECKEDFIKHYGETFYQLLSISDLKAEDKIPKNLFIVIKEK